MAKLVLLVGPPGSGKSTHSNQLACDYSFKRISQDDQGKVGHIDAFNEALFKGMNIVVDRMNFNKVQRDRYLIPAKAAGYETEIIVLHESYETCLERCLKRQGHPTIKDETNARSALNTFFGKYERVQDNDADKVTRIWPKGEKDTVIICDLDGTLCNVDHRLHFVKDVPVGQKKDWKNFFYNIPGDHINTWCSDLITYFPHQIVYCSGRPDNYRKETVAWLEEYDLNHFPLFMRPRNDSRQDDIVKEIILDFEILTRFNPYFAIDDRDQVVRMWRKRGITCLQCANGDF